MEIDRYKLEDALSTLLSTMQDIERRAMNVALKGGVTNDTRRVMLSHIETMRGAINKLPELI